MKLGCDVKIALLGRFGDTCVWYMWLLNWQPFNCTLSIGDSLPLHRDIYIFTMCNRLLHPIVFKFLYSSIEIHLYCFFVVVVYLKNSLSCSKCFYGALVVVISTCPVQNSKPYLWTCSCKWWYDYTIWYWVFHLNWLAFTDTLSRFYEKKELFHSSTYLSVLSSKWYMIAKAISNTLN